MRMNRFISIMWVLIFCLPMFANTEEPRWMSSLPHPSNSSFYYVRIEALATDVESAKKLCLKYLASRIELEQSVRISEVSMTTDETTSTMENGRFRENIVTKSNYSFRVEGTPVNLTAKLVDEFLVETIVGGKRMLKMNTLYAVARKGYAPVFDDISFSRYYGMQGFARSLIPGWGQMYKGSTTKGLCILGGEVVCIGGIIVCENLRSSYIKKMKEQPKFAKDYSSKADNWENGRNFCIGAAAALYVYNLIDAIAAKGAKRVIVKPTGRPSFSLVPTVMDTGGCGLVFAYRF